MDTDTLQEVYDMLEGMIERTAEHLDDMRRMQSEIAYRIEDRHAVEAFVSEIADDSH